MTKQELIEKMAKDAAISKAAAGKALDSFIDSIKKTLKKGNNDRININDREMKNSEPFSIRMTAEVKATLQNVLKERKVISPYIFTDEQGRPYSRNAVSMPFRRACKRAVIEDLRFHDLRHDFATLLINNGASLYQVRNALGHKDQRMSARYAHLLPENRDVINMIEGKGTTTVLLQSTEKLKGSLS